MGICIKIKIVKRTCGVEFGFEYITLLFEFIDAGGERMDRLSHAAAHHKFVAVGKWVVVNSRNR